MRCKGLGCKNCRKNKLDKAKCWKDWGLCGQCAVRLHPDQYNNKIVQSYKKRHEYNKITFKGMQFSKMEEINLGLI